MTDVRYDNGAPKRDLKYDIIIRTSNIDITELDVLLDVFRDRGWSLIRDVSNRNRFNVPWDALKPEYQEFYVPSSYRQAPVIRSEELGLLGPPLVVSRLEGLHSSCSSWDQFQCDNHSPNTSIGSHGDRELSTPTSSVAGSIEVISGDHPPDSATQLSPSNLPLGFLYNSDLGTSLVDFAPFHAPTAEVADLALDLAQKAGVDTCSKDSPTHGRDC